MLTKIHTLFLFLFLTIQLTLYANDNNSTAISIDQNTTFISTYWKLENLKEGSILPDNMSREAHIVFSPIVDGKGKFKGASGCNGMFGKYVGAKHNITIDTAHIAMSRMACPDMKIEAHFIKTLGNTRTWKIDGGTLEFIDSTGTSIALFIAVEKRSK